MEKQHNKRKLVILKFRRGSRRGSPTIPHRTHKNQEGRTQSDQKCHQILVHVSISVGRDISGAPAGN
jgi:hypothetical protein